VVSRADREVEDHIRAKLAVSFPYDAILGEEGGATAGTSGFTWVIDPIDGAMPFLSGLPHWCVAFAVVDAMNTVLAVTHAPVTNETYDAVLGGGARVNGAPMVIDPDQGLTGRMTALGGQPQDRFSPCRTIGQRADGRGWHILSQRVRCHDVGIRGGGSAGGVL
jgi:myo-inositol-1(or 4)-monophosphatase